MDFRDVDDVKVEKERAMTRYRRVRSIAKVLRLLEVCVALTILSWSSTRFPTVVRISVEYLLPLSVSLPSTHIVFLIGNAIVGALYLLSRQNDAGNNGGSGTVDLYEEYVQSSESRQRTTAVSDGKTTSPPATVAEEMTYHDKQMVLSENAVTKSQCDAVETAIKQATKEIRRFQRTQSEKLRIEIGAKPRRELRRFQRTQSEKLQIEIGAKPRRELRRSDTDTLRRIVPSGDKQIISSIDKVDNLSNEEFRRTIDEFISNKKRFMRTQKMADADQ